MHRNTVHFRKSKGSETTGLLGLANQKGQGVMGSPHKDGREGLRRWKEGNESREAISRSRPLT